MHSRNLSALFVCLQLSAAHVLVRDTGAKGDVAASYEDNPLNAHTKRSGICSFHVQEMWYTCADKPGKIQITLKGIDGQEIGGNKSWVDVDKKTGLSVTSPLPYTLDISAPDDRDVGYKYGALTWKGSTEAGKGRKAWCKAGGWDPKKLHCRSEDAGYVDWNEAALKQMDCSFEC